MALLLLQALPLLLLLCAPIAYAAASAGCGRAAPASGDYTWSTGGVARRYRLHVPAQYDASAARPLVLLFHGWGEDESAFLYPGSVAARQADKFNYVLAAPVGLSDQDVRVDGVWRTLNSWSFRGSSSGVGGDGAPSCDPLHTPNYTYNSCKLGPMNGCGWTHCMADDVAMTVALVARLSQQLCLDTANVFAMGGSNGGMFTWELGQNPASAPLLRAIAPLIGLPIRGFADGKGRAGDLPVLLITGLRDTTVPPGPWGKEGSTATPRNSGQVYFWTSATTMIKKWSSDMGCATLQQPSRVRLGSRGLVCKTFCAGASPKVVDCRGARMGHTYNDDVTIPLAFRFFRDHSAQ
jgi:poly(3-hydroxybutyrate) depolymerase